MPGSWVRRAAVSKCTSLLQDEDRSHLVMEALPDNVEILKNTSNLRPWAEDMSRVTGCQVEFL